MQSVGVIIRLRRLYATTTEAICDTQREIRFFADHLLARHPELHIDGHLSDLLQARGVRVGAAQRVAA